MKGFLSHVDTVLSLPARGVVLVEGLNGAGKSTVIEGVAYACWGETLRGTDPWAGSSGEVGIETYDGTSVTRSRKGGRTALAFAVEGAPAVTYETTTKAQEALERVVGAFDVWRRACAFSSHDAAHFTLARDADRKRLLETILGLERFDAGLIAAREKLRGAEREEGDRRATLARAEERARGALTRKDDADRVLAAEGPALDEAAAEATLARVRGLLASAEAEASTATRAVVEARAGLAALRAERRTRAEPLSRTAPTRCPTCGQAVAAGQQAHAHEAVKAAVADLDTKIRDAEGALSVAEATVAEAVEDVGPLRVRVSEVDASLRAYRAGAARRADAKRAAEAAQVEVERATAEASTAREAVYAATGEVATWRAVERVLGTKGVRAHVLGNALSGLEAVANLWLAKIAGRPLSLRVGAYTEKKTGGVSDAISLDVIGAGNGHGYRASSGGERRRIDVALLLALGEVAAAAHGRAPGTLFLDEVADAVDVEGVPRVAAAIEELAADRCVVVVTHNVHLARSLDAVARYEVAGGAMHAR
jgi:exonuclease SbcC